MSKQPPGYCAVELLSYLIPKVLKWDNIKIYIIIDTKKKNKKINVYTYINDNIK